MSESPNFNRFPGPGDLTRHQLASEAAPDFGEVSDFLAEHMPDEIRDGATELLADYLSGMRDGYAEAKAHRQLMELAGRCDDQLRKKRAADKAANDEMRNFYRNRGEAA